MFIWKSFQCCPQADRSRRHLIQATKKKSKRKTRPGTYSLLSNDKTSSPLQVSLHGNLEAADEQLGWGKCCTTNCKATSLLFYGISLTCSPLWSTWLSRQSFGTFRFCKEKTLSITHVNTPAGGQSEETGEAGSTQEGEDRSYRSFLCLGESSISIYLHQRTDLVHF